MTAARGSRERRKPHGEFADAVLAGLARSRKTLPCRYFYDETGSRLFEEITRVPEYYPARTERRILETHALEIAALVPVGAVLVEFGSGSSLKTEILLSHLPRIAAYVAIDVSESALAQARARLRQRFPRLDIRTIVGNFAERIELPPDVASSTRIGFFPGSTIGNLLPADAVTLLKAIHRLLGADGRLVIGIDLKKDVRKLVEAYDDSGGVTAAFNLNLLTRINRELGADFDLSRFSHRATYNPREGRIEMHLRSISDQTVTIGSTRIHFREGETIHTESSYKYTIEEFQDLARRSGWAPLQVWTDQDRLFSVHVLG